MESTTTEARRTKAWLACGAIAGPVYVLVTAVEALSRAGFDPRRHRYNVLTLGDAGWVHRANYVVAGLLTAVFAAGVRRVLERGRAATWASRFFALYGLFYVASGVFPADPAIGFPPGTLATSTSWHGILQMASRSLSSAALVGASVVMASWFRTRGLRGWSWFCWAAVPMALGAFALLGVAGVETSTKYLAFLVPGLSMWIWITALAVHLRRTGERHDVASSARGSDAAFVS